MTTALYRRYRPETFAEVIGQEQVTTPLSTALTKNRVNHAYLFSGPRGCGKTTSARILARCLNCTEGPTATPCGVCDSCVELARGGPGSLDVVEIDAASHGGVDDARDLRERAAFAPVRDRFKVFIIDEAHMVSPQGFNALLKIVEEPPEHIRFIFATTEPDKVIGTIRSRTHHYPFRLVPPERLTNYLAELCEREGVPAGKGVLPLVVRAGAGSVRDSLSVLDQLIGGAGPDGLTYQTAIGLLGYTDAALLDDVVDAMAAADGATVFRVVDRVIESGHDARRFVEDLLERFRDLLVVSALRDGGHAIFRGLPDDQLERMRSQASRFGAAELSRAADVSNSALTEMTGATSPRLQLELLCARLLLPAADDANRGLGARVDRLEKRLNLPGGIAPAGSAPMAASIPVPGPAVAPSSSAPPAETDQAGTAQSDADQSGAESDPRGVAAPSPPAEAEDPVPQANSSPSGPSDASGWQSPTPEVEGPPVAEPPVSATALASDLVPGSPDAPPGSASDLEAVRRMWSEVLNALATLKRTTWSLVSQYAQVLDYDGKRLLIGFDSAGRAQSFSRGPHQDFLRQALIDVIGIDCAIEATGSPGGPAGVKVPARTAPAAAPATPSVSAAAPAPAPRRESPAPAVQSPARTPVETSGPAPSSGSAPSPASPAAGSDRRPSRPPSLSSRAVAPSGGGSPFDDVPPNLNEPPAGDDEVPPDEGPGRRPAPQSSSPQPASPQPAAPRSAGPARSPEPPAPAAKVPAEKAPAAKAPAGRQGSSWPVDNPSAAQAAPSQPPPGRPSEPAQDPSGAAAPAPSSGRAAMARARSAAPAEPAAAEPSDGGPVVLPADDVISVDDADLDSSTMVGASVVEQLLGGRVIEEIDR